MKEKTVVFIGHRDCMADKELVRETLVEIILNDPRSTIRCQRTAVLLQEKSSPRRTAFAYWMP